MDSQLNFTQEQIAEANSLKLTPEEYAKCIDMLIDTNVRIQGMIRELDESTSRMEAEMREQQKLRKA